ncbi:piggyBac transposable element-derived protein 4-like [Plectropomus leopardus]|uniref:piggyBac transposable element-derived protein 4-like n=1 Tax=Plectropomus leopardus TaxID=160734 RepID=UPI001C4D20AF|nr:piggyBac transposable element-derived protein 4-like [Plectropomus leopardus]
MASWPGNGIEEARAPILDSCDDGESGAESFLTDYEIAYQQGLHPGEDVISLRPKKGPQKACAPIADSDDDGESGAESFLTDDDIAYQQGLDPAEDFYDEQQEAEEPNTSAAGQHASSSSSSSEGQQSPQHGRDQGHVLPLKRSHSPPHKTARGSRSKRGRGASRGQKISRSSSPLQPRLETKPEILSWKTQADPDVCPEPKKFAPARPSGHQLNSNTSYTPIDLFKLFLSNDAAQTICQHTNKQAAKCIKKGKRYSWTDISVQEFFKYVGLNFFFALVKIGNIQDYWKKNTIFSLSFPATIMPRDRFRVITWNIHLSDPDKDAENDRKKGTPDYDHLFRLKPLMDTIKNACRAFYHPRQNLSINERIVTTKGHNLLPKHIKGKPPKWRFKLFVLADSVNGYTLDFSVYTGKSQFASGVGIAYDSVMSLMKSAYLGSGFQLFVEEFYTSPKLFKDLFSLNIGACGSYRDNRRGCPRTETNALQKKDPAGSIRWIRDGPLVFVKWMDTSEVSVCSTIHEAFSGSTVQRRVRTKNGTWITKSVPCPTPVMEFNKHMGGVDLTDQLIQSYSVHHKSIRWYRTLFFHFLDIAASNSFLLHKELCREKQEEPGTYKAFLQELTAQLCGVSVVVPRAQGHSGHLPVAISEQTDASKRASYGRRTCLNCREKRGVKLSTPWKCMECDVALCLIANRNCFQDWHK